MHIIPTVIAGTKYYSTIFVLVGIIYFFHSWTKNWFVKTQSGIDINDYFFRWISHLFRRRNTLTKVAESWKHVCCSTQVGLGQARLFSLSLSLMTMVWTGCSHACWCGWSSGSWRRLWWLMQVETWTQVGSDCITDGADAGGANGGWLRLAW